MAAQSCNDSCKQIQNKTSTTRKNIGKTNKKAYHDERNGNTCIIRKEKGGKNVTQSSIGQPMQKVAKLVLTGVVENGESMGKQ